MAAPTTGLTVIKRFTYRGNAMEEYSNHYWLTGATPADSAAWRTLFDALVTQERTIYPTSHSVVAGYGYSSVAADRQAVWSVDLTLTPNTPVTGSMSITSAVYPGDVAAWVRWGLDRLNTKGKRVYLRKYFHGIGQQAGAPDSIQTSQITALAAFGSKMWDGTFSGGRKLTDTLGTNVIGSATATYATTRTLKRRGKRPGT